MDCEGRGIYGCRGHARGVLVPGIQGMMICLVFRV